MSGAFLMKRWTITVRWASGTETSSDSTAATRGKALADAWRSDAFSGSTFGEFMKFARCRRTIDPQQWGDQITVEGKPAFYLGRNSQYVRIAYPDSDVALNAHPLDVSPESYRPECYRSAVS